jgi:hypothetical protein
MPDRYVLDFLVVAMPLACGGAKGLTTRVQILAEARLEAGRPSARAGCPRARDTAPSAPPKTAAFSASESGARLARVV